MVLLDALVHNRLSALFATSSQQPAANDLIVAHFDHGIREDSAEDEVFVRKVAQRHGLQYESMRVALGDGASEEKAREARYKFLRQCCSKYGAQLMTAHHRDDVIETMLINLIRGTGWRGLAPMAEISNLKLEISNNNQKSIINNQILRPLLRVTKKEIQAYAEKYNVVWREDSTNEDANYLRNYLRLQLLPLMREKDTTVMQKLLSINEDVTRLKKEIATELQKIINHYSLTTTHCTVPRYELIMFPSSVAKELLYQIITMLDPRWHPNTRQLQRILLFIKTAQVGKSIDATKRVRVVCDMQGVHFL